MLLELPRAGSIFRGCADSIVRSSWSTNSTVGVSGDGHVPVTCIGCGGGPRSVAMLQSACIEWGTSVCILVLQSLKLPGSFVLISTAFRRCKILWGWIFLFTFHITQLD